MQALPSRQEMYEALVRSDRSYDGIFFIGVTTTGIFCRPTCPAKTPRPENVEYFPLARDALIAGYRPCRRCRPLELFRSLRCGLRPHTRFAGFAADSIGRYAWTQAAPDDGHRPPEWITSLLRRVDRAPTTRVRDADLRAMSIDPSRVRRYFRKHYGMTFHAYHRARRMGLALSDVRRGRDLGRVAARHGYDSPSGFRSAFRRVFGAAPTGSGTAHCLLAHWLETPLGGVLAVAGEDGLCLLEFVDRRALETQITTLRRRLDAAIVPGRNSHLDAIADELTRYFDGTLTRFTVPLVLPGTPFQVDVWRRLQMIPYGETSTYGVLAADLGRGGAHRAVGRANGLNRIAIVIPCHRVVRSDGTLCGYGGGLWRKKWLLEHEKRRKPGEKEGK